MPTPPQTLGSLQHRIGWGGGITDMYTKLLVVGVSFPHHLSIKIIHFLHNKACIIIHILYNKYINKTRYKYYGQYKET